MNPFSFIPGKVRSWQLFLASKTELKASSVICTVGYVQSEALFAPKAGLPDFSWYKVPKR
jgi:hypothetical protein